MKRTYKLAEAVTETALNVLLTELPGLDREPEKSNLRNRLRAAITETVETTYKEWGRRGGKTRAARLDKDTASAIGAQAARARWAGARRSTRRR